MKKKIMTIITVIVLMFTLTSCTAFTGEHKGRLTDGLNVMEYVDEDTGVCYLVIERSGVTVEYNADGTIKTKEVSE